jgi:hypothetical protein
MKLLFRAAAVAALLVPLVVAQAQGQNYRTAFGLYGGGFGTTALNPGGEPERIFLKPGWIAGAQFEGWLGQGRFGLRLNGAFTDRPFEHGDSEPYGNVNTYLVDLNALIRLARPAIDRVWAPFLNLGVGVVHYNPGGDHTGVQMPQGNAVWVNDPETMLAGVVGLGTDIFPGVRVGVPVGFRIEAANHIAFESPLHEIAQHEPPIPQHGQASILALVLTRSATPPAELPYEAPVPVVFAKHRPVSIVRIDRLLMVDRKSDHPAEEVLGRSIDHADPKIRLQLTRLVPHTPRDRPD